MRPRAQGESGKRCSTMYVELCALAQNEGAVRFYRREGFLIQGRQTDRETGETELILCWEQRRNAVP